MATTAIVAETLIIGLQTALWVVLIVINVLGIPTQLGSQLKGWEVLVGVYVFAVAYTLGIIFDRLTAALIRPLEMHAWKSLLKHHHAWLYLEEAITLPQVDDIRMDLRVKDKDLADEVDDIRRPLRVVRATALNLIALMIVLLVSLAVGQAHIVSQPVSVRITLFCVIALLMAVAATAAIELQYYRRLIRAYAKACPELYAASIGTSG